MKKQFSIFIFLCLISLSFAQLPQTPNSSIDTLVHLDSPLVNKLFTIPFSPSAVETLERKTEIIAVKKHLYFKQYLFLILLNLFSISVFLFSITSLKVKKVLATLFNINMLKQFSLVESKRSNKYLLAYFLLFLLYFGVLIYILNIVAEQNINLFLGFSALAFFLLFDLLVNLISAFILQTKETYATVLFNNSSFLFLAIPYFIISSILIIFLPEKLNLYYMYFFIALTIIVYLWKEIRNIFILGSNKIKIFSFYFFIYLCTFKILPLVVFVKTILQELTKQ